MRVLLVAATSAALAVSACAPVPDETTADDARLGAATRCFSTEQVRNFRQGRTGQVFVRAGGNVFEIEAYGCNNLDFAQRLAFVPDVGGGAGGRVCTLDSLRIVTPGATSSTDVCRARVTRVLTDEEVAALPSRQRP